MWGQPLAQAKPRCGCGVGGAAKDQDMTNERQDLNGHCPEQSSKAFSFGHQLIIQTSRFEKEDV